MADAATLTRALGGKWHGHYGVAFCPAHDNRRTPALSLADGSEGRLLATCFTGCDFAAIIDALRGLGLVDGRGSCTPLDPVELVRRRAEEKAQAEKRVEQARRLWRETQPICGTPGEVYFRTRGITAPLPDTLRFHGECWHCTAQRAAAIVALVEGAASFAVHRTYLRPDGIGKADLDPPKAMLGGYAGGAVRLSEAPGPLVAAEGIETALSLMSGLLNGPATVWAALSTSGVKGLHLPAQSARLTIAPDGDTPGRDAAHALAARADALGWRVSFLNPPEGFDWNDVLQGRPTP